MTTENASRATDNARPNDSETAPYPIQDWENREFDGKPLVAKRLYDAQTSKIAELRERHQAYHDSLPTDPLVALKEIRGLACRFNDVDEPQFAPLAVLEILHLLFVNGLLKEERPYLGDAMYWLTTRALDGMRKLQADDEKIADIAAKFIPSDKGYQA